MKYSFVALYLVIANVGVLLQTGSGRRLKPEKTGRFRGTPTEPEQMLLAEMEERLGSEHPKIAEEQVEALEEELEHTFKALPKNGRGSLTAPSVRYALNRLFNQRYGWQIKGLRSDGGGILSDSETGGGAWDSDSPVVAMGDRVPAGMQELFEERLGNYGLNLHELALLAATLENMFHTDVVARLQIVYQAYSLKEHDTLPSKSAMIVMKAYIASLVLGSAGEQLTPPEVLTNSVKLPRAFSRTAAAMRLLHNITREVAGEVDSFDKNALISILSVFGQKLGSLEDTECKVMKEKLISREVQAQSGRVRLGDFYKHDNGNGNISHFTEGIEYMRAHGVLDESSPEDPKVIIPNYLAIASNCLVPSGHYAICCFDECESLMDKIEVHIGAPVTTPAEIAAYVSSLASASLPANRTLSAGLLRLLDDVASHHGGQVPIHGRLFSQWMHQAYPRECSHPYFVPQNRFQRRHSEFVHAKAEDKRLHEEQATVAKRLAAESGVAEFSTAGLWSMHEELVDAKALDIHRGKSSRSYSLCVLVVVGCVGALLVKMLLDDKIKQSRKIKLL